MTVSRSKAHLHLADVFRWSTAVAVDRNTIISAGIGMVSPIGLAAALGNLPAGVIAALGSMMVVGPRSGGDRLSWVRELIFAATFASITSAVAILAAGHGWISDAIVIVLAGVVATLGGYSRQLGALAAVLIMFMIIILSVAETMLGLTDVTMIGRVGLVLLIVAGTLWTATVRGLLNAVMPEDRNPEPVSDEASIRRPTGAQKIARWRDGLSHPAGWQYPFRLTLCLTIAAGLRVLWPDHHLYWIALTVALLTERQIEAVLIKTTQRVLGTILGVLAAAVLLAYWPPLWALVPGLGVLACLVPLLRLRNYLAYSIVMTPVIMVIMDAGRPFGAEVLIDRLVATLIGAALVVAANLIVGRMEATSV